MVSKEFRQLVHVKSWKPAEGPIIVWGWGKHLDLPESQRSIIADQETRYSAPPSSIIYDTEDKYIIITLTPLGFSGVVKQMIQIEDSKFKKPYW